MASGWKGPGRFDAGQRELQMLASLVFVVWSEERCYCSHSFPVSLLSFQNQVGKWDMQRCNDVHRRKIFKLVSYSHIQSTCSAFLLRLCTQFATERMSSRRWNEQREVKLKAWSQFAFIEYQSISKPLDTRIKLGQDEVWRTPKDLFVSILNGLMAWKTLWNPTGWNGWNPLKPWAVHSWRMSSKCFTIKLGTWESTPRRARCHARFILNDIDPGFDIFECFVGTDCVLFDVFDGAHCVPISLEGAYGDVMPRISRTHAVTWLDGHDLRVLRWFACQWRTN